MLCPAREPRRRVLCPARASRLAPYLSAAPCPAACPALPCALPCAARPALPPCPAALPCPAPLPCRAPCLAVRLALPCALPSRPTALLAMAALNILTFDLEGRPIEFNAWLDNLHLFRLIVSKDGTSLFDLTSGTSPAPDATGDSPTRSQWLTCDAAARLAVRNHLPLAERAHFGQHKTAKALYDAVVPRYSSPATAALSHLLLPYLFPELSAFATAANLVTHLHTSDTRYHVALPAESLAKNPPPVYITLYFIVTHLPDSLTIVRDLLLALDPTDLTIDLLEKHLRLPLVGGAAAAGAGEAAVGVVEVEAVVGAVEEVEGAAVEEVVVVGVEGQVAGVVAAVGVVEAAVVAAVVAAVGVEAAAMVVAGVVPAKGEALEVARGSSSINPFRLRSSVSGLLSVGRLGAVVPARMSFAQVIALYHSDPALCTCSVSLADPSGGPILARSSTVLS
ncbi:unnamed protein product [Closterium sp. NIES-65]|nr:unnamed protein product [Closterium sp. NIES-65]